MKPTIEEVRRDTRTSCLSDESKAVIYDAAYKWVAAVREAKRQENFKR